MKGYFWPDESIKPDFPGESFEEFVSNMGENYLHPDDKESYYKAMELSHIEDVLKSKIVETQYFRMRRDDTEYRYKCLQYCYLDDDKTEIMMYSQDVDQIRGEQIREEEAKKRVMVQNINDVQSVMEMKRNFSSMIARELTAPLQYVRTALQENEDSDDDVLEAVSYMSGVIENITEYEKMERGQLRLENNRFALDEMLEKHLQSWERRAAETGIHFKYNVSLQWKNYYGDEIKIGNLLDHLIGNSIMASSEGETVEIWVNDIVQGLGANKLIITVEDWGIPVNDGYFGRDYPIEVQTDMEDWKKNVLKTGTAFSLVVAKKLVGLMGGKMTLNRKGDAANVLYAEFILQKNADTPVDTKIHQEMRETGEEKLLDGYSLLLVRNPKSERKLSGAMLQLKGAKADVASNGVEALELLETYRGKMPDAILVEGNLQDMDCLEFTEELRRRKQLGTAHVFVIGIVEEVSQEIIQAGMKIGVNGWLDEPSDMKRLRLMLDTHRARSIVSAD
jgi:signal transduction histidine kinase